MLGIISAVRHLEIFIRPDLSESKDLMPMQVAAVLGHELVHAAVGVAARLGNEQPNKTSASYRSRPP